MTLKTAQPEFQPSIWPIPPPDQGEVVPESNTERFWHLRPAVEPDDMTKKITLKPKHLTGTNPGGENDYDIPLVIDRSLVRGWPMTAVQLAEAIGCEASRQLRVEYAGSDYCYIPKSLPLNSRIVRAIGAEAADRLVYHFGGLKMLIATIAGERSKKAAIAAAEGTTAEIAARLGVSPRWVRWVRNAGRDRSTPQQQRAAKKRQILEAKGATAEIAARLGVSQSWVREVRVAAGLVFSGRRIDAKKHHILAAEGTEVEIATRLGVSREYVRQVRKKAGIAPDPRSPSMKKLQILEANGPATEVAARLGVSREYVHQVRKKARIGSARRAAATMKKLQILEAEGSATEVAVRFGVSVSYVHRLKHEKRIADKLKNGGAHD